MRVKALSEFLFTMMFQFLCGWHFLINKFM